MPLVTFGSDTMIITSNNKKFELLVNGVTIYINTSNQWFINHNRPPVSIQRRKTKYWLTWIFKPGRFLRHVIPSGVPLIRLGELAFSAALVLFPGLMLVMGTLGLRMKEFKQIVLDIQDLVLTSLVYLSSSSFFFLNSSNY